MTPSQLRRPYNASGASIISDLLRRKEAGLRVSAPGHAISSVVHDVLRTPGQPLDPVTRAFMEPQFGHDFSGVRVHTDARAAESAQAVSAQAYTVAQHVVFGTGQYRPLSSGGMSLIAHELAHVVQQSELEPGPFANLRLAQPRGPLEQRAEAVAAGAAAGCHEGSSAGPLLQRAPLDQLERPLRSRGDTLPYREATELADCIRILGEGSAAYCRQQVLGEPAPPQPTHHQLPGITTPMPIDVELNPDSTASLQVNQINVVFDPDAQSSDPTKANQAETNFNLSAYNIHYNSRNGRVTDFTGPGPVEVRIQTTYGPGAAASTTSGYGRGTTREDVASHDTSLGFHEGRHGLDFMEFMDAHPFPRFVGRVGMTAAQFSAAMRSFEAARERYRQEMKRFSQQRTDCVGRTIDVSNAANGIQTSICQRTSPGRRP